MEESTVMSEQPLNIESEQFMTLLTEALRSGPGSPEWHQAVSLLRAQNGDLDEYKLLYAAREHLESGKDFRSVRAGPGFTRKVMDEIEQAADGSKRPATATMIAAVAAITILAVILIVAWLLMHGGSAEKQKIDELTSQYFVHDVQAARFDVGIPDGWQAIGELPVVVKDKELRPGPQPPSKENLGGGVVSTTPLPADGAFQISAVFHFIRPADDTGAAQLFISDEPITPDHPQGSHELVCQLQNGQVRVVLPGSETTRTESDRFTGSRDVTVLVLLNRDLAVIDSRGNRLYAGPNALLPDKPRYVGVRFLRRAGDKVDPLGVTSIAVQKP